MNRMTRLTLALILLLASSLLALAPAAAAQAKPDSPASKTIAFIVAENEYKADTSMPAFAKLLADRYGFQCELMVGSSDDKDPKRFNIPNIAKLKDADLAVVFVRRRPLPPDQMQAIRDHLGAGKPLVAIRTASHAFATRNPDDPAAKGMVQWPKFDKEVLGCNYTNHYGVLPGGTEVTPVPEKKDHPILAGVDARFISPGSLYKINPLEPGAEALLMGAIPNQAPEPVLVLNQYKNSRVVYTSLGHPDDFKIPAFERLMINTIFWALKLDAPKP